MLGSIKDPLVVSFSTQLYEWLLTLYPPHFYREYAGPMQQVFRDYSLKTYAAEGPLGMLWLWVLTLFDLFKSLVEEHLQKETHMSNAKFIRLSGWAMIAGMVVTSLSGNIVPFKVRRFLWTTFEIPGTDELIRITNATGDFVLALGLILVTVGLVGLLARYGNEVANWGKFSLQLSLFAPVIMVGAFIYNYFKPGYMDLRDGWIVTMYAALGTMILFSIFGLAVLQTKPLPYWNGLPLLVTLPILLWFLIVAVFTDFTGPTVDLGFTILGWWALLGFLLLGYLLQSDAVRQET